jgi:hypothetical protein
VAGSRDNFQVRRKLAGLVRQSRVDFDAVFFSAVASMLLTMMGAPSRLAIVTVSGVA